MKFPIAKNKMSNASPQGDQQNDDFPTNATEEGEGGGGGWRSLEHSNHSLVFLCFSTVFCFLT